MFGKNPMNLQQNFQNIDFCKKNEEWFKNQERKWEGMLCVRVMPS